MTARSYLQLLLRRWYVLTLVAIISAAAMVGMVSNDPGVYWTRATVVFVTPVTPDSVGNVLEGADPSLVYFAAAVEQRVNGATTRPQVSSPDATLYGTGIRRGYDVSLLNSGGQWQASYDRPMLTVQVVDSSPELVQSTLTDVLTRIDQAAVSMQLEAGARETNMITTEVAPQQPAISYVGGNSKRGMVGIGLLGLGIGLAAAFVTDNVVGRMRTTSSARRVFGVS